MKLSNTMLLFLLTAFVPLLPALAQEKDSVDVVAVLKRTGPYDASEKQAYPDFSYQRPDDPQLTALRETYHLDSVAGKGNEVNRAIRLLEWMHNTVPHEDVANLKVLNARNIIETYKEKKYAQGCYGLSISMNEIFLAMGFKSRSVICFSNKYPVPDGGHVINSIYIDSLQKWVWMDPQENAYVMDEKGNLLGIAEVRQRLVDGKPLVLNKTANYHQVPTKKEVYLYKFMAEHIYRMICPLNSEYNSQTRDGKPLSYVELLPLKSIPPAIDGFETKQYPDYTVTSYHTSNDVLFWKKP